MSIVNSKALDAPGTHLAPAPQGTYRRSIELAAPIDKVFAYCATREGFERQFPHLIGRYSGPETWGPGSRFAFHYRFFGLWLPWEGEFIAWEPGVRFVDQMKRGTFKRFVHTHSFEPCPGGTRYTDSIEFSLGLGSFVDRMLGAPLLERTFKQRHARLLDVFGAV